MIHVYIQQRSGRKSITIIQGVDLDLDLERMCRSMRRCFHCNGTVVEDVIQLQGDQRDNVRVWLIEQEIATNENILLHG